LYLEYKPFGLESFAKTEHSLSSKYLLLREVRGKITAVSGQRSAVSHQTTINDGNSDPEMFNGVFNEQIKALMCFIFQYIEAEVGVFEIVHF
jgi:hypothetical protein